MEMKTRMTSHLPPRTCSVNSVSEVMLAGSDGDVADESLQEQSELNMGRVLDCSIFYLAHSVFYWPSWKPKYLLYIVYVALEGIKLTVRNASLWMTNVNCHFGKYVKSYVLVFLWNHCCWFFGKYLTPFLFCFQVFN